MDKFEQRVIISGIGQSEISRRSNNSELALTFQACRQAVADAGIDWSDIDGLSTYPGEIISTPGFSGPGVYGVQDMLRLQLNWHLGGHEMPGQLGAIIEACLAVAGGLCRHALVYRTLYEGTGQGALGRRGMQDVDSHRLTGNNQWLLPFGAVSGANWCALLAQRYFYEYGTTREQLAWVALNDRANALLNELAAMRDRGELTLDEYMNSRMISSPLCLYDCDYPVDGSVAFVISPAEHASSLDHRPVRIEAFGAAQHDRGSWTEQTDYLGMGAIHAGAQMWSRTQLRATDVGSAISTTASASTRPSGSRRWDFAAGEKADPSSTAARRLPEMDRSLSTPAAASFRQVGCTGSGTCTRRACKCKARRASGRSGAVRWPWSAQDRARSAVASC